MIATKEEFKAYRILQEIGVINMLDVLTGCRITHMPQDHYKDIIKNYNEYKRLYEDGNPVQNNP